MKLSKYMADAYNSLVEKIALLAKLEKDDVERKVEAKRAKLSGLVSKEGAAQIVAAELGINFDKERMKIAELVQGMKKANIIGKALQIFPVRQFNKNGREGKVANMIVADDTANIRVVLWDTNHIRLIENGEISQGDALEISGGMIRNGELHLSSFGDIKKSNELIEKVVEENKMNEIKLSDAKAGQKVKARAFIVHAFDPKYFEVCSECGKKVIDDQCMVHGKVAPKKRALLSAIIDDGSCSIRAVLFAEQIASLGITDENLYSLENFAHEKANLLGEERFFTGNIRNNQLYNTTEFMVEKIEQVSAEKLIEEMQKL